MRFLSLLPPLRLLNLDFIYVARKLKFLLLLFCFCFLCCYFLVVNATGLMGSYWAKGTVTIDVPNAMNFFFL